MLVDPNIKAWPFQNLIGKNTKNLKNKITGSTMPVVWKKNYGKGRIFYSSIGHHLTDFDVPEVMTIS